jgi:hypothetical protein
VRFPRACLYCARTFYGHERSCGHCHGDDPTAWALTAARDWFVGQDDAVRALPELEQRVEVALVSPPRSPTPGAGIEFR